jgi:hypothetical protein
MFEDWLHRLKCRSIFGIGRGSNDAEYILYVVKRSAYYKILLNRAENGGRLHVKTLGNRRKGR